MYVSVLRSPVGAVQFQCCLVWPQALTQAGIALFIAGWGMDHAGHANEPRTGSRWKPVDK